MNVPLAARNLGLAVINRARKAKRHYAQRAGKAWRVAWKEIRNVWFGGRSAILAARDWLMSLKAEAVHLWRSLVRLNDSAVATYRTERRVRRQLGTVARGTTPVIVGPWLSEVGFEILYWIPFLHWFRDRYRVQPERMIAVSRGGVAAWYGGVASTYFEIFDTVRPEDIAREQERRRRHGDQKQFGLTAFDERILGLVRDRFGLRDARVCHPSLMYHLFRQFWLGNRSLDFLLDHVRFRPVRPAAGRPRDLPERYVAVKFYTGAALPDSPGNRQTLRALVAGLAERLPVVALDTGVHVDEHRDYLFDDIPRVIRIAAQVTPAANLGVQTEVIAGATLFVGTCGSVAWLAPMLGVDTVAVYADDKFLASHLYVARHAYRLMNGASFAPLDLNALDRIGARGIIEMTAVRTDAR